jgi:hypothetical protein
VFREENQVHVVHGDDGWEESEEAWELGEEEMMIVGTVQQEDDCSWQDASKPWIEQDEEVAVGVYQVGACRGADGVMTKTGEEAAGQPPASQCQEVGIVEAEWQAPGPDDLLLEGEEGEYFLELLMSEASPGRLKADQPMGGKEDLGSKAASTKGKEKKKSKKKPLREGKAVKENGARGEGESAAGLNGNQEKQAAPDLLSNQGQGQGQGTGRWRSGRGGVNVKIKDDLKRGVFRTEDAGFLRSSQ